MKPKGWHGEGHRHSLASRGIKTSPNADVYYDAEGIHFKGMRMSREQVERIINEWKHENAKQKARQFLNNAKKRPLVTTHNSVVWGLGGEIRDGHGNVWRNIAIYDRPDNPIEGTKAVNILPHMTKKNFTYLDNTRGVTHWNIRRNPFVASSPAFAPLISTLGIKIKADTFQELDVLSDSVNVKLRRTLKLGRRQVR